MSRQLIVFSLLLTFIPLTVWAESYPNVEYRSGYPALGQQTIQGAINVTRTGVNFEGKDGQTFRIQHPDVREQWYETVDKTNRRRGFAFAGPNPILMAATLGASLAGNALMAAMPEKKTEHFYKLVFETPDYGRHEITFKVPDAATQKSLITDVKETAREVYTVLMEEEVTPAPAGQPAATLMPAKAPVPASPLVEPLPVFMPDLNLP